MTAGPIFSEELEAWDVTDEVEEREALIRLRRATISLFLFELLLVPPPPLGGNGASLGIALSEEQAGVGLGFE